MRAEMILMLSEGRTVFAVAEQWNVKPEAIRERRRRWLKKEIASLPCQPRCGAPSKLSDAYRSQLKAWIDGESLACQALVSRLATECEVTPVPAACGTS